MAKSVNPKKRVIYILEAERKIIARREALQQAKAEAAQSEQVEADKAELPEVLDPAWRPTKFICTHLTAQEQAHLTDIAHQGAFVLVAWDFGVADVEDFYDESGNPIKLERDNDKSKMFDKRPWLRACLDRFEPKDREEVATFIVSGCKLEGTERKNS